MNKYFSHALMLSFAATAPLCAMNNNNQKETVTRDLRALTVVVPIVACCLSPNTEDSNLIAPPVKSSNLSAQRTRQGTSRGTNPSRFQRVIQQRGNNFNWRETPRK